MPDSFPLNDNALTQYAQLRITLYPEKFGIMGQYAKELLRASSAEDAMSFTMDSLLLRLTTSVLCGRTVSETPQVKLSMPESPWQHLKDRLSKNTGRLNDRWQGHPDTQEQTTPPPWMVLLWPLLVLFPKWLRKHPVKWTEITADIEFEQRVLYPEIDMPAQAGRAVIYETMSVNYPHTMPPYGSSLSSDPSRFLNKHEIMNEFRKDPTFIDRYGNADPFSLLLWLERHGVNTDQLVKRR